MCCSRSAPHFPALPQELRNPPGQFWIIEHVWSGPSWFFFRGELKIKGGFASLWKKTRRSCWTDECGTARCPCSKEPTAGSCSRKGADREQGTWMFSSALVRPHLGCTESGSGLLSTRNVDIPEQIQQRATKMMEGREQLTTEGMPRELQCPTRRALCTWWEGEKMMEPGSAHWCPVVGREAVGTHWHTRNSV